MSDGPRNCITPSFQLFSRFTAVKESVCIVILSLVSTSATRMVVISASNTDVESLSLMIMASSLCTIVAAILGPSHEPSV